MLVFLNMSDGRIPTAVPAVDLRFVSPTARMWCLWTQPTAFLHAPAILAPGDWPQSGAQAREKGCVLRWITNGGNGNGRHRW
jgi:hypothetical protein